MRLRLFDRIRRLVRPRHADVAGAAPQGRHRRDHRQLSGYGQRPAAGEPSAAGHPAGALTGTASDAPGEWHAPGASVPPPAPPAPPRRPPYPPAVRVGGARARVRDALGEAAPDLPPARYQAPSPADLA